MPVQNEDRRILVVEDEFLIRLTLSEALRDEGFVVIEAQDAQEGLELLRRDPSIRLLMTDLALAGAANGTWLAQAGRELRPGLPVIYMTGRPDRVTVRADALERVVGKPYSPADICALAHELLGLADLGSHDDPAPVARVVGCLGATHPPEIV